MTSHQQTIVIPKEKAVFRMDGNGIWHNEHGPFEHSRIISYFNRSIRKDDFGYFVSQIIDGEREEKVYFSYVDTAVFVTEIKFDDPVILVLNTGDSIPLDPSAMFIRNDSLFVYTPEHLVKFNQKALVRISTLFDDTGHGMELHIGTRRYVIPEH